MTTTYGKNSPLATLRPVVIACFVERKLTAARMRFLETTAAQCDLAPSHISKIVADYERDVLECQETSKDFFFGDGALPKDLVHAALDEIEHLDLRLQVALHMMRVILREKEHSAKEVAFVEGAVAYWGIKTEWRALVDTMESSQDGLIRGSGSSS